jgi:NAD(P)-dependent dehydrogenase (short-subunit alcohol dehydrogenase family)
MENAVIIGAGPGIGAAVARRFVREGFGVGLIARSGQTLVRTISSLPPGRPSAAVMADSTDDAALRYALDEVAARLGPINVLVYNAAIIRRDLPGELSVREHEHAWATNVVGAITAAAHLGPRMAEAGHGTILLTGGMREPVPERTSLSLGKAGLRTLTQLLADQYEPAGVHVAMVTVTGVVEPGTYFDPDEIAEHYWDLHCQAADEWSRELVVEEPVGLR